MRISDLWGKHRGETIWVVGTGPSLRVVPHLQDFLSGKLTIGLNQAWRHFNPVYSITIHPELLTTEAATKWIVKGRKASDMYGNQVPCFDLEDPRHYVFITRSSDKHPDAFETCGECSLYQGGGIQTSAMHCAFRMGAKAIMLLGVDQCSLDNEHHGHEQHVRWAGKTPEDAYAEYRKHSRMIRDKIVKAGVPVLTVSPFVGLGHAEEDYRHLKAVRGLVDLPPPVDVSGKLHENQAR